nr:MAG TPA: Protein of unknown function (DUF551) [Caudoviricetes sp.]
MTDKEIIQALRCTSTPGGPQEDCTGCTYYRKEQLDAELKEKLGVDTWPSCDVNKVGMDAADIIERLTAENRALRNALATKPTKRSLYARATYLREMVKELNAQREKTEAERDALREKVPRWISVDDRHPKPGTRVLATDGVFVGEAYRTSADTWRRYDGIAMRDCIGSVVTHWMPLPEAPEEGEKA